MKKLSAMVLSIAFVFVSLTVPAVSVFAMTENGVCGDNVTYAFNSLTGVLTVSGTGDMYNYDTVIYEEAEVGLSPFNGNNSIKEVVINEGVTTVGTAAFVNCAGITGVDLPESLTLICHHAFDGCTALTSVLVPKNTDQISDYAFCGCTALSDLTITDGVREIAEAAFKNCTSLESVNIPKSVTDIVTYDNPFAGCSNLSQIAVDGDNSAYDSRNGCNAIISKSDSRLVSGCVNTVIPETVKIIGDGAFADCIALENIDIPNSVESIYEDAFSGCTALGSIILPDSVKAIHYWAFNECTSLERIVLPNSVTYVDFSAFRNCTALQSAVLSDNLDYLPENMFDGCTALTSVKIGKNTKMIGDNAFLGCTALQSITIPNGVTDIIWGAFQNCRSLKSINIPASVKTLCCNAFDGCSGLERITVSSKNKYFDSRNKCNAVINKKEAKLIVGCKNTVIPENVKTIGDYAFSGCSGLKKLKLPASVKTIGNYACSSTGVANITLPDTVTVLGAGAFKNCKKLYYVKLSDKIKFIDFGTFSGCPKLQNVVLSAGLKKLEVTAFSRQTGDSTSGLNGINLWYPKAKSNWNSVEFTKYYTYECGDGGDMCDDYEPAAKSWKTAYTNRTRFGYKNHSHKWKNKYSVQPTFEKGGVKSCTCSECGMKFVKIPCGKLVSPSVTKVTAAQKALTVTWKKAPTVAGYQVQYSTKSDFKKAKRITVKKSSVTKHTFKKLKSKKTYFVRVRAFKKINGKTVYSKWSEAKKRTVR